MKKFYFVIIWLIAITILIWPKHNYHYLKLNSVAEKDKPVVLFEKDFYSLGNDKEFYLTTRSYVQGTGNGIVGLELNGKTLDSGDTLANPSNQIQSQTIVRVRDTKFGKNKIRVLGQLDSNEPTTKLVVVSLGILIK